MLEDPLPSNDTLPRISNGHAQTTTTATNPADTTLKPRDARLLHLLLTNSQVPAYSPKVPIQLLDFSYRYLHSVLLDAQAYADHVHGQGAVIGVDDVRLAVSSKVGHSFRGPPPKEFLLEVAAERNRRPLPAVREGVEIRLPPERWCLNAPNWESLVLELRVSWLTLAGRLIWMMQNIVQRRYMLIGWCNARQVRTTLKSSN
jgi:transcription initiation factor TFIID subunit 9B